LFACVQTLHIELALQVRLHMAVFEGSTHYSLVSATIALSQPAWACWMVAARLIASHGSGSIPHGGAVSTACADVRVTDAAVVQAGEWLAPQLRELMPWVKLGTQLLLSGAR
jgi:hypothetical protein